jgi:hypothetical protein
MRIASDCFSGMLVDRIIWQLFGVSCETDQAGMDQPAFGAEPGLLIDLVISYVIRTGLKKLEDITRQA